MTEKAKKISSFLFLALIPALPLFEIYRTFFGGRFHLFGFAAEELLLLFWVGGILSGGLLSLKEQKKDRLFALLSFSVLIFYTLLHGANAAAFEPLLLPDGDPDFFREVYYTLRTWLAPIFLLAVSPLLPLEKKSFAASLKALALVVSLGIALPCLFGFSYASYLEGNQLIHGSFFSWFHLSEGEDLAAYTARGFFPRANSVGAVLFGISPVIAHFAAEEKRFFDRLLLFLVGFASICVGTKIAAFGFFLSAGAYLLAKASLILVKKDKRDLKSVIVPALILLFLLPVLLISPGFSLQNKREEEKITAQRPQDHFEEIAPLTKKETLSREDVALLSDYLSQYGYDHFIDPWFPALYPAEADPEFWLSVLSRDGKENSNARKFKTELLARIREKNENTADLFLGMGFTSGIPYAERDFIHQFYQFGILGALILLLPFLLVFLRLLKGIFSAFPAGTRLLFFLSLALSLFAFFAAAYLAGHVFDALFSTYVLSFVCAYSLRKQ